MNGRTIGRFGAGFPFAPAAVTAIVFLTSAVAPTNAIQDAARRAINTHGRLVHYEPLVFPESAKKERIIDPVVLRLEVDETGIVSDVAVLQGHPLLNDSAVQTVKRWRFEPLRLNGGAVPLLTTLCVSFQDTGMPKMDALVARLLARIKAGKPANPEEGQFVVDGRAGILVVLTEPDVRMIPRLTTLGFEITSSALGSREITGRMPLDRIEGLLDLKFIESIFAMPLPIRNGNTHEPKVIQRVEPIYPADAQKAGVHGPVKIEIEIDEFGNVSEARIVQGNPLLNRAAIEAVGQWRYSPLILNGVPIPVMTDVELTFK